jgi:hypothetical protein
MSKSILSSISTIYIVNFGFDSSRDLKLSPQLKRKKQKKDDLIKTKTGNEDQENSQKKRASGSRNGSIGGITFRIGSISLVIICWVSMNITKCLSTSFRAKSFHAIF